MPAGLGGSGWLAIKHEAVLGTYLDPSTAGTVWVPILEESLVYDSSNYYSPQIRQSTIVSEAKPSYYSVSGDVTMEVDAQFLPYFLHCSRHTITKSGAGPYVYKYAPSTAGSATTAASGNVPRSASLTVVRNGIGFGYGGCVLGGFEFTITDGVLRMTAHVVGMNEALPAALGTPAWVASKLHGADAHAVYVDVAGTAPAFATPSTDFNGFTANFNYNADRQNRIRTDRSASYISYGESEISYDTELDFVSRAEFDNMKAVTKRAVRLQSIQEGGSTTWAATLAGVRIDFNNATYDSYEMHNSGMGDLVMAAVTGRALGIAGGDGASVSVTSGVNIA